MTSSWPTSAWIHRLEIENFRRFAHAELNLKPGINCLIGSSDAGKTTILSAIEFVLWPSYALTVTDNDFHNGCIQEDLVITAWIANPPVELRTDAKYLGYLQGFHEGRLAHDPTESDDDLTALQIEFRVAQDLEPTWTVIKEPLQPRQIRAADRGKLGLVRIGEDLGKHLRWTRGSALMRLTPDTRDAHEVVRAATRAARQGASARLSDAFRGITDDIMATSRRMRGLGPNGTIVADTDLDSSTRGLGQVALHTGADVPVSRSGQGTQRIVTIASQLSASSTSRVLLLDELEQGLEPHRVQHLISILRHQLTDGARTQVLMTTHSPRAIRELRAEELVLVGADEDDRLNPRVFPKDLQGLVRWSPDALLAPRIIVCEGATEVGLMRGLVSLLQDKAPPVYATVEAADAGGKDNVVSRANALHSMGYLTAAIYDLDVEPKDLNKLNPAIQCFPAETGNATEQQLLSDLTDSGVRRLVVLAMEVAGFDDSSLKTSLKSRGCTDHDLLWLGDDSSQITQTARAAIGQAAKSEGWFKRITLGELLMTVCRDELVRSSHMDTTLVRLEAWMSNP